MRILVRYLGLLCLINTLAICLGIAYGMVRPASILNWNGSKITLYDARTGVDYSVRNSQLFPLAPSISGVEIMPSADENYTLTIRSDPTGLEVTLSNQIGENLLTLSSGRQGRINNLGWIDTRHFILIRVHSGSVVLSIINVETLEERSLGAYPNTAYSISPNREWLLLIHNDSNESLILHLFDERRYQPNPIADIVNWSDDGRYLASRAMLDDSLGFQLLDTQSGEIVTDDLVPNRLSWSSDNQSLIIYDRQKVLFYRQSDRITETDFSETIVDVMWSYDGRYALLITQAEDEKMLYLVDNQEGVPHFLVRIPNAVDERSIVWGHDNHTLTYILPNPQANEQSSVFWVDIERGTAQFLTYIPSNIARAHSLDTINYYGDIP